jgi:hypothetical protein
MRIALAYETKKRLEALSGFLGKREKN